MFTLIHTYIHLCLQYGSNSYRLSASAQKRDVLMIEDRSEMPAKAKEKLERALAGVQKGLQEADRLSIRYSQAHKCAVRV